MGRGQHLRLGLCGRQCHSHSLPESGALGKQTGRNGLGRGGCEALIVLRLWRWGWVPGLGAGAGSSDSTGW